MRRIDEPLPGVLLLEQERRRDERGFFARCFCRNELAAFGDGMEVVQANLSGSRARGTLRGLHYQLPPSAETKLVQCVKGAIFDVALDLRTESPHFGQWFGTELAAATGRMLLVPEGCAHGFLTLEEDCLVHYTVSAAYDPARERGVRFDDPRFAIRWPFAPAVVSARDRAHPDFDPAHHLAA